MQLKYGMQNVHGPNLDFWLRTNSPESGLMSVASLDEMWNVNFNVIGQIAILMSSFDMHRKKNMVPELLSIA